jgi:hypothetical protein
VVCFVCGPKNILTQFALLSWCRSYYGDIIFREAALEGAAAAPSDSSHRGLTAGSMLALLFSEQLQLVNEMMDCVEAGGAWKMVISVPRSCGRGDHLPLDPSHDVFPFPAAAVVAPSPSLPPQEQQGDRTAVGHRRGSFAFAAPAPSSSSGVGPLAPPAGLLAAYASSAWCPPEPTNEPVPSALLDEACAEAPWNIAKGRAAGKGGVGNVARLPEPTKLNAQGTCDISSNNLSANIDSLPGLRHGQTEHHQDGNEMDNGFRGKAQPGHPAQLHLASRSLGDETTRGEAPDQQATLQAGGGDRPTSAPVVNCGPVLSSRRNRDGLSIPLPAIDYQRVGSVGSPGSIGSPASPGGDVGSKNR